MNELDFCFIIACLMWALIIFSFGRKCRPSTKCQFRPQHRLRFIWSIQDCLPSIASISSQTVNGTPHVWKDKKGEGHLSPFSQVPTHIFGRIYILWSLFLTNNTLLFFTTNFCHTDQYIIFHILIIWTKIFLMVNIKIFGLACTQFHFLRNCWLQKGKTGKTGILEW